MKTLDIRRRIRGVHNTRKITHAMELVAATKMRRATAAVLATRRYAQLAWELLRDVRARSDSTHHPLLAARPEVRATVLLVIAGNRGLVGAFNQKLVALALAHVRGARVPVRVLTAGKVAARLLHRAGVTVDADFPKKDLLAEPEDAAPIAAELLRLFLQGDVDRVHMVYEHFHSPVKQEPRVRTLLPVEAPDELLREARGSEGSRWDPGATASGLTRGRTRPSSGSFFLFEPSPADVLGAVVPNLISVQVYQALLETTASEHAARMVAMKNATENAEELTDDLTLVLNQARQQQITRELQEIVSGSLLA